VQRGETSRIKQPSFGDDATKRPRSGLRLVARLRHRAVQFQIGVRRNMNASAIDKPNTGHHHLLIDAKLPSLDQPIPNDFNHLHFGGADRSDGHASTREAHASASTRR
jgi:hypothetical protein